MKHTKPQLRKVAILVANLDAEWGDQILSGLSPKEIVAIEQAIDNLGYVDPEELRDTLEEFRRQSMPQKATEPDGVELDESLLQMIERESSRMKHEIQHARPSTPRQELASLNDVEPGFIVQMLAHEHPQTIAVVLSRLDGELASVVLGNLSIGLQAEVLVRLTELDTTDELSLSVVEEQVAQWINEQRQRQARMAAGRDIVTRILDHTSAAQRGVILARIQSQNPMLAAQFAPEQGTMATSGLQDSKPMPEIDVSPSVADRDGLESSRTPRLNFEQDAEFAHNRSQPAICDLAEIDYVAQLEQLDNNALLTALTRTSTEVVTLALAGASESLLKKVVRHLSRRDAKAFRSNLRNLGPTRLADMIAAQRELLLSAH